MSSSSYYDILGVDPNASPDEIRKAYKRRALQTHPDRLPQGSTQEDKRFAEEEFRKVNNAYEVLINPDNRKAYDLYGVWPPPAEAADQAPKGTSSRDPFFADPFNDPFFRSPFNSTFGPRFYGNRRPYVFRDPFELFDSIFAEIERGFQDFDNLSRVRTGFVNQGPSFPSFLSQGLLSPFSNPFGNMRDFPTEGRNVQSFSYSSRGAYQNDGNGGPQWISQSSMQRTINGETHTTVEKKDSEGNVHVRKIYPDGRENYTINGVEQSSSPPAVQSSSSARALTAPPTSNNPPVKNSRPGHVQFRTHHSSKYGKERENRHYEPTSSRIDRHSTSSSHSSSTDRTLAERERAERRSKRTSQSQPYDYEAAPPPLVKEGHPKKNWWGRG